MTHEAVPDRQAMTLAQRVIGAIQTLEVGAQSRVVVRMIATAERPVNGVDGNDPARAQIVCTLYRKHRRLFPVELVLGLELDARDHCRIDVAPTPQRDRTLERFDPARVA